MSNPHRLRIVATLTGGRNYVSQLARDLRMSRPLLHMHLKRLEAAGIVSSELEVSEDGKAMNFYEVRPIDLELTPELIAEAVRTLTDGRDASNEAGAKEKSTEENR